MSEGPEAVKQCMREHKDELSEGCRQLVGQHRAQAQKEAQEGDAASVPGSGPMEGCKDDVQRLCADRMSQGRDAVRACMREHMSELSAACQVQAKEARQARIKESAKQGPADQAEGFKRVVEQVADACRGDAGILCSDAQVGNGRLMRCLLSHEGDVTDGCRSALESAKPHLKGRRAKKDGGSP